MATTPNYGFDIVSPDDGSRMLIEWMQTTFGSDPTSTIMMLDKILHELSQKEGFKVVESVEQPTDLKLGDEWDKIL